MNLFTNQIIQSLICIKGIGYEYGPAPVSGKGTFRTLSLVRVRNGNHIRSIPPSDPSGGKGKKMAKIEDGKYKYSKFSEEDAVMYWEILENLPYDPQLEEFFLDQGETDRRLRKQDHRHIVSISMEYVDSLVYGESAENAFFHQKVNAFRAFLCAFIALNLFMGVGAGGIMQLINGGINIW